jgi:hypothetical protein
MPFGLAIVNKEDYHHLIRQNNAMTDKLAEIESKDNAKILELQEELRAISEKYYADLEMQARKLHAQFDHERSSMHKHYESVSETTKAMLAREFSDTLAERDAELQRSVDQATSLGYDNELLRKANEDLATELEVVKRSENEKWIEANAAQAEVIRLKAEIEMLTPKRPAPKRGKRNG